MKSWLIPLLFLVLIVGGGVLEQVTLSRQFETFDRELDALAQKIEQNTATEEEMDELERWWDEAKKVMHTYIPHTEIREIDYWLAEAKSLVRTGNFELADAKLTVLRTITSALPDNFRINFENLL